MEINLIGRHLRPWMENASIHGHCVTAIDGFSDWDASRFGKLLPPPGDHMRTSPAVFFNRFEILPGGATIFCSPIENCFELLRTANEKRKVLNASPEAMEKARDLQFLKNAAGNLEFPEISFDSVPPVEGWIIKNRHSAGGLGVRKDSGALRPGEYRQKLVTGRSVGAVFYTAGGKTSFFGAVNHINHGFLQGGGIYPDDAPEEVRRSLAKFGDDFGAAAGLAGWWGADVIIGESIHLLEVNPRFTASLDLIARAHRLDVVRTQAAAFNDICHIETGSTEGYLGAMIVYAEKDGIFRDPEEWYRAGARDIPRHGQEVRKGSPVLTFYAKGKSADGCRGTLAEKARELQKEL